jgi:membrane protease YdiL (CAAX protease family)
MAPNPEAPEAPEAEQTLARLGGRERVSGLALVVFGVVAVGSLLAGPLLIESIWLRMAALDLLLLLVALAWLRLDWMTLWRPTLASSLRGLGAGLIMWAGAFAVAALLTRVAPTLWAGADELYAWADDLALAPALALLIVIVAGEEIIWRGALGLGVAAKLGAWPAVLISAGAFTLAHASIGSPVLLVAAALAGAAWTYLAIRTRSLWAPFVAHLLWDVGLLWLTPLI